MSGKSIGLRIGSLIRQYGLRIAYAKGKISLYEAERAKYESLGRQRQAASAKLSRNVWAAYCNAITAKRDALMEDVRQLLSGYTGIEYDVWVRHCVNGERMSDIANDLGYNLTCLQDSRQGVRRYGREDRGARETHLQQSPQMDGETTRRVPNRSAKPRLRGRHSRPIGLRGDRRGGA